MKDEPSVELSGTRRSLEVRLAQRPELRARLDRILDMLDHSVADGCDAHAAEERVIGQQRQLGQEVLGQWAQEANAQAQSQVPAHHPQASAHGKKTPDLAEHLQLDLGRGKAMAAGPARSGGKQPKPPGWVKKPRCMAWATGPNGSPSRLANSSADRADTWWTSGTSANTSARRPEWSIRKKPGSGGADSKGGSWKTKWTPCSAPRHRTWNRRPKKKRRCAWPTAVLSGRRTQLDYAGARAAGL
jgi:hypothetical protein